MAKLRPSFRGSEGTTARVEPKRMVLHGEPVIQSVLLKYFTFVDRPEALINHGQCSQALQKVFKNSKFVDVGPLQPIHASPRLHGVLSIRPVA